MTWKPEGIIIHCTATHANWWEGKSTEEKIAEIRRWHVDGNGWSDIGYAELYDRDGTMGTGRDLDGDGDPFNDIGAHTKGWNSKSIGICLFGGAGSTANDEFSDHFTPEQDAVLRRRIAYLRERFPSIKWVKGHNEFANKACPGFNVSRWLARKPAKGDGMVEFVKGSKDAKVIAGTATIGAVTQASGDVKTLMQNGEQILGFSPVWLLLACVLAFLGYTRWQKWQKGIR